MRGPWGGPVFPPNCMWIGSAVSMQLSRESTYTLQWGWICPPKLPLPLGDPPNVWLLVPTRVHNPSGISIGSAIFAGLTVVSNWQTHRQTMIHTHTHPFNGPFSETTQVSWYQKGKTNLDFTEARYSEWQWHQLDHMHVCTSLQTDNHASTPPLSFYRPDALPAAQPTASKHWRHKTEGTIHW